MNYVYIGAEKTSTTYLQRLFNSNKAAFAEQAGITYLSAHAMSKNMVAAAKEGRAMRLPEKVSVAGDRNLMISEFFYRDLNTQKRITGLKPILDAALPGPYRVVMYVRDQTDWIVSYYSTYIKRGGVLTFEEYVNFILERKQSLHFAKSVGYWQAVFGDALDVYHYKGGTVLHELLERFDVTLDQVTFKDPGHANVSLPVESMEILRHANSAMRDMPNGAAKDALQKALKNTVMDHAYGAHKLQADATLRARIVAHFSEGNRALNAAWGMSLPE
ncbi:hypothetical protein [uncultured Sulfitobacter sp.]|uniref:hypothetical protein n=1 Tax=uncultured Sulfitobacter sp. TaxID=191468 RepID=UPI002620D9D1|nr:hypothetical protein [uncultured Sulfitobacter sp.]